MEEKKNNKKTSNNCYHCGESCGSLVLLKDEKPFCCQGCLSVFEILSDNNLCDYYSLEQMPGISFKTRKDHKFEYLDHPEIIDQLIDFKDETISKVVFYIPQIHCSSCLWLLENLYKINPHIIVNRVNFVKKELSIHYEHEFLSLRELVGLLTQLGYEPSIGLNHSEKKKPSINKKLWGQTGLAGFAFGNIMLMSLPEYFGFDKTSFEQFSSWFGYINILLATPVVLYSAADYFKSSLNSVKVGRFNIDVPISIGVFFLYTQSLYEIILKTGPGYLDSLCGLLFFLLIGKVIQDKTYSQLSFERDYTSYFPISVNKINSSGEEISTPVKNIVKGDSLRIRNGELIPVDAKLLSVSAMIDNSFATGESDKIAYKKGEKIYAGGVLHGESIEVEAQKQLSQSKLVRLWNEHGRYHLVKGSFSKITDSISQWFTPIILIIAITAGLFYLREDWSISIKIISAVLIVACPCALALASPFTFGHANRYLGRKRFYLRDANVIEDIGTINYIVFDKTGTLTYSKKSAIKFHGEELSIDDKQSVRSILYHSNHPLSRLIFAEMPNMEIDPISNFKELPGKGIQAEINEIKYRIGSATWLGNNMPQEDAAIVMIEKNSEILGYFTVLNEYRTGLSTLIENLKLHHYKIEVLSGDNNAQLDNLKQLFGEETIFNFNQSPQDKLARIEELQKLGKKVMMVGDGLNDAGALLKSNVGVAVSENINSFSPACDAILDAKAITKLGDFLSFTKQSRQVLIAAFIISLLYNVLGLTFAVQGLLSPIFAAILMPLSSISVVGFVSIAEWVLAQKLKS